MRARHPDVWPRRGDWWLPLGLALVAQGDVWAPSGWELGHLVGPPVVVSMLYTLTAASLAWRRLAPAQVLAFIVVADTLEYVTFGAPEGLGSLLPTVVAFFAVGRYARAGALTVAGPLALLGIVVHELRDPVFQLSGSNAVFYGVVAAAWPIGYAFRIRADQAAVLRLERDRAEAQRLVAAEQAIDAERTRISRELHDIVGHGLSVLVLQQVGASAALDNDMLGEARRLVTDGERVARETLAEMRRLLVLLGDEPAADLPPGLHDIDRLVRDARSAGAQVSVTVMGTPTDLSPGLDLTAFRILQEGLTNVLKHAQPPECEIEIRYEGDHFSVAVIDHGQGAAESRPGRGLSGMAERANVFGGTLTHGPTAAGGFAVCARLPVRT